VGREPKSARQVGSDGTYDKRFANAGIKQTEQERRRYRELIITTPGLGGKRVRRHSLRRDDPTCAGPERHGASSPFERQALPFG
jgi:hypothetical protein